MEEGPRPNVRAIHVADEVDVDDDGWSWLR